MLEQRVVLAVEVRRFKCANAGCPRRTFAENIHALAGRHQWVQQSQAWALHALGHALCGEAAARLANVLVLCTSADTVLKFVTPGAFPERAPKARGPTPLDPYRSYIEERIAQGCRFPELIWQELKQRG